MSRLAVIGIAATLYLRVCQSRIARSSTCRQLGVRNSGKQIDYEQVQAYTRMDIKKEGRIERYVNKPYDAPSDFKKHIRDSRFYRVAEILKFVILLFSSFALFTSATFTVPDSSASTT